MSLPKGRTNNPHGRPRKSLSKISGELREDITKFLSDNLDKVIKEFDKLDNGTQKIKLYIDLLGFALPRLKASESNSELGNLTEKELQYIIDELKKDRDEAIRQTSAN